MIIYEMKLKEVKSCNEAYKYCKVLADDSEFPWAKQYQNVFSMVPSRIDTNPVLQHGFSALLGS